MYNWLYEWTNQNPGWTREQKAQNVDIIAGYFTAQGWTLNAICAMLGNMEAEGLFNPAQWQFGTIIEDPSYPNTVGFGLVQWTPWQKYAWWAEERGYDWRNNYDYELERIQWELDNGEQWDNNRPGHPYPESFYDFSRSEQTLDYLTECFFWCYEYGTWDSSRISNAYYWWDYLSENPPPQPTDKKFKIMFYLRPYWKRR